MPLVHRVLDATPCPDLATYEERGGGRGLAVARSFGPAGVIEELEASGLRGRGGAGFPTGRKWRTVADSRSRVATTSVVVNGAEGEPGTFKDRALLRRNPYKVLEGALIAAAAVGADEVIVCLKASFEREVVDVLHAIDEAHAAGWAEGVRLRVVEGPSHYLFGEETALLEVVEGRQPFPRVDPPFRRGVGPRSAGVGHGASRVHLAGLGGTDAAPALVNNVETMANVPGILGNGADWYRSIGSEGTPGSVVCTITGDTRRHGVGEVEMGTSLREAINLIGGGPRAGREILAVLSGVANPIIPAHLLDTPLCFDAMSDVGAGLGAAGFIVFQDHTNLLAVARDVARFLAIESCGQCDPCKRDGLAIANLLGATDSGRSRDRNTNALYGRLATVTRGARCALASQQEQVIGSILELVGSHSRLAGRNVEEPAKEPSRILPLVDIVDGRAVVDSDHLSKQPDWTHNAHDSGSWPAARLGNRPIVIEPPVIREQLGPRRVSVDLGPGGIDSPESFPTLLSVHRELEAILDALERAEPAARPGLVAGLHDLVRQHVDVTQRVLYPMVQRIAGAAGDDASSKADDSQRAGLRALDLLADASSARPAAEGALLEISKSVRAHINAEQRCVIPLLEEGLEAEELDELADALNEARLRFQLANGRTARRHASSLSGSRRIQKKRAG